MNGPVITVTLDRPRSIKWSVTSTCTLGRLAEPPPLADIFAKNAARGFFALCAWVWAALEEQDVELGRPEAIAPFLDTPEKQHAAYLSLRSCLERDGILKKKEPVPTKSKSGG